MKFRVTQDLIDAGRPGGLTNPMALAVQREFPGMLASVTFGIVRIGNYNETGVFIDWKRYSLPIEVGSRLWDYDDGRPLYPFEFFLTEPGQGEPILARALTDK